MHAAECFSSVRFISIELQALHTLNWSQLTKMKYSKIEKK